MTCDWVIPICRQKSFIWNFESSSVLCCLFVGMLSTEFAWMNRNLSAHFYVDEFWRWFAFVKHGCFVSAFPKLKFCQCVCVCVCAFVHCCFQFVSHLIVHRNLPLLIIPPHHGSTCLAISWQCFCEHLCLIKFDQLKSFIKMFSTLFEWMSLSFKNVSKTDQEDTIVCYQVAITFYLRAAKHSKEKQKYKQDD